MEKYINGGIIKSFTVFYGSEEKLVDILDELQEKIDLNLFEMNKQDGILFFDIKKEALKDNFVNFLKELKVKELNLFDSIDYNIKFLEKNSDMDIEDLIEQCDDVFIDYFDITSINSLYSRNYKIEVEYYAFYYDGPFGEGYFNKIINLLFELFKGNLENPLKNALCFGLNG